jgi:hypothetical protein
MVSYRTVNITMANVGLSNAAPTLTVLIPVRLLLHVLAVPHFRNSSSFLF